MSNPATASARSLVRSSMDRDLTGERVSAGLLDCVAAADIGGTRIRMLLADLKGVPFAEWSTHLREEEKTPAQVIQILHRGLAAMQANTGLHVNVTHFTAGVPGITDFRRGVVLAAPNLSNWAATPFRAMLQEAFGVPAEVDNDTNLAAVGEHAAGVARGVENFLFVALGTGVGSGIFLNGALYRGTNWSAGEIGYLTPSGIPRQPTRMEETGPLEQRIGGLGIEAMWVEQRRLSGRAMAPEVAPLRAPQVFDLAADGDLCAQEVLDRTARMLADALGTMALLFDPQLIVLGGGVGSHPALSAAASQYLNQNEFAIPTLAVSSLGTQAQLFGAVAVALDSL